MALWGRIMDAINAGIRTYNEKALVPDETFGWDEYAARLFRYFHYGSYHDNTVYSRLINYASTHRERSKLYQHTRAIYNPVARQNRLIVSNVYQGAIDLETMTDGALPIKTDNDAVTEALRQVIKWSKLGQNLSLYVRWAALLGDVAIKVVDDRDREKVRLELLHPGKIRECEFDEVGNVKSVIIEYERVDDPEVAIMQPGRLHVDRERRPYTYTEKITRDKFQTFKDGEPFAFYADAGGNLVPEWDNEYGFVPMVVAHYDNVGMKWGANAFSLEAALTGSGTISSATVQLVVSMVASLSASGTITKAQAVAILQMVANIDGTASLTSALTAIGHLVATVTADASMSPTMNATANMEADITPFTELSPESLAASVWNSIAADYNSSGTMGEKLNSAGTAGDPWTADLSGYNTADTAGLILKQAKKAAKDAASLSA